MKKLLLNKSLLFFMVLLLGVTGNCLSLSKQDTIAITAGSTVAVGLWSWWGHISNKNAMSRAEILWNECSGCIDKHHSYVCNDLRKSLHALQSCSIIKRQHDIVAAYKSLSSKMDWFWNRSHRMKDAYAHIKILQQSLDQYLSVFNEIKQKIASRKIADLWNKISLYDVTNDPGMDVIKNTTLQNLRQHILMLHASEINSLYMELFASPSYCSEFGQARDQIAALKKAHDRCVSICGQIEKYDDFVKQYQDFLQYVNQPFISYDVLALARKNSSGEYPLLNFVEKIDKNIAVMSSVVLRFNYIRLQNNVEIGFNDALAVVLRHLNLVRATVVSSSYYADELRYYREKMRLLAEQARLAEEQRRLQASIKKVNHEINHLKDENWRLTQELKNKQI